MKIRTIGLTLALCFFAGAACFAADDPNMGTWKLNEAKSKLTPGEGKNTTVVYEAAGDQVKVIIDGTDKDGKPTHNEWTGKFDGKDYAVTGDPKSDMRAYKKIDEHTLAFTVKKDGKTTITGRIVVAADGKSRMVTARELMSRARSPKRKRLTTSSNGPITLCTRRSVKSFESLNRLGTSRGSAVFLRLTQPPLQR